MATISKLVVHHSESPMSTTTKADIAKWHREKETPIIPIGYHKLVTGAGSIEDARPETFMGAHALGANLGSLGVCVFGNFDTELPTEKQIDSLVKVLVEWCKNYNIKADAIYGHFEVPGGTTSTACPGKNLKLKLALIRKKVKKKIG